MPATISSGRKTATKRKAHVVEEEEEYKEDESGEEQEEEEEAEDSKNTQKKSPIKKKVAEAKAKPKRSPRKKKKTSNPSLIISSKVLHLWTLFAERLTKPVETETESFPWGSILPFHATDHRTPVFSMFARCDKIEKVLDDFLKKCDPKNNDLVTLRCMRGTLHIIEPEKVKLIRELFSKPITDDFKEKYPSFFKTNKDEFESMRKDVIEIYTEGKANLCLKQNDLKKQLLKKKDLSWELKQYTSTVRREQSNLALTLRIMFQDGDLHYHLYPAWKKDQETEMPGLIRGFSLNTAKISKDGEDLEEEEEEEDEEEDDQSKEEEMLSYYFTRYGPATANDYCWFAGKKKTETKKNIQRMIDNNQLFVISVEDEQEDDENGFKDMEFLATKQTLDEIEKFNKEFTEYSEEKTKNEGTNQILDPRFEIEDQIWLLPYEDAMIKSIFETRHRFYDKTFQKLILRSGEANPTVWKGGKIVGVWEIGKKSEKGKLVFTFFEDSDGNKSVDDKEAATFKTNEFVVRLCSFLNLDGDVVTKYKKL